MDTQSTLSRLLQSRSRGAQITGIAAAFILFLPAVFRIADDPDLSFFKRCEQLSLAAGQLMFTVILAALPSDALLEKNQPQRKEQPDDPA